MPDFFVIQSETSGTVFHAGRIFSIDCGADSFLRERKKASANAGLFESWWNYLHFLSPRCAARSSLRS